MRKDSEAIWRSFGMVDSITIYPLADVHLGAEESAMPAFSRLVAEIAADPNAYVVLAGDLLDAGLKNSVTNVYRATMPPSQQKREMADTLKIIRDKILCIVPGNHERRSVSEVDDCPSYDIASKLDLEDVYRENMAVLRLTMGDRGGHHHNRDYRYNIVVMHGAGGGSYPGATVNRNEMYLGGMDGIDVLIAAHAHKPYALRGSKLVFDIANRRMVQRPTLSMCAGSWMNYGGYPIAAQMRPVAEPGANKLVLHGTRFRFEAVV